MMLMALLSLASGVPLLHLAGYVVGRWPDLIGPARLAPWREFAAWLAG
jgi:hypothetical protein